MYAIEIDKLKAGNNLIKHHFLLLQEQMDKLDVDHITEIPTHKELYPYYQNLLKVIHETTGMEVQPVEIYGKEYWICTNAVIPNPEIKDITLLYQVR